MTVLWIYAHGFSLGNVSSWVDEKCHTYTTFALEVSGEHPLSAEPDNPPPEGMAESGTLKFWLGISVAEVSREVQALAVPLLVVVDVFFPINSETQCLGETKLH